VRILAGLFLIAHGLVPRHVAVERGELLHLRARHDRLRHACDVHHVGRPSSARARPRERRRPIGRREAVMRSAT